MAYDLPYEYKSKQFKQPGYMFLPLADGVFEASLRDFNDVEYIGEHMADTIGPLFLGMNISERLAVLHANNMVVLGGGSNAPRSVDPAYDGVDDEPHVDLKCFPEKPTL